MKKKYNNYEKEDTSKILELMNKVISALDNGKLIADDLGVNLGGGSRINSTDNSLQGELTLTISSSNNIDTILLQSYDYPDLKSKMIELRDSIKASRMNQLTNQVIIPMITEIDKIHDWEKKILDQVLSQEIKSGVVYKCFQDTTTTEKRGNLDFNLPVKTGVSVVKDNEEKIHITILRASGFWETELLIIW